MSECRYACLSTAGSMTKIRERSCTEFFSVAATGARRAAEYGEIYVISGFCPSSTRTDGHAPNQDEIHASSYSPIQRRAKPSMPEPGDT